MKKATKAVKIPAAHMQEIAQRMTNADTHFAGIVMEILGCDRAGGMLVLNKLRELRCIKRDMVQGRWNVTHGAILDAPVLLRVLEACEVAA